MTIYEEDPRFPHGFSKLGEPATSEPDAGPMAIAVCVCGDDIELLDFGAEGLQWAHLTMEPDRDHRAEPLPPPTRACCGQPHAGVTCPDGLVMCCLCFNRVPVADLATEDGQPVDVCRPCMAQEARP